MRIVTEAPLRRMAALAWTAAGLVVSALAAAIADGQFDVGWLTAVSWLTALTACALVLALPVRLRSVMVRNDEGYAALFEGHPQPIFVADNATLEIVAANAAASEKYGYSAKEFDSLSVEHLHRLEDREEVRSAWAELGETARRARLVARYVSKHGSPFAAEVLSTTLELNGRRVRMTVVTDVTDRDDALADTRHSSARYRQLVDTAKEGVLAVDEHMAISAVNQRATDMLGYAEDELVGHRLSEFSATDGVGAARAEAVQQTDARLSGERETTLRRKDGTIVSVLLNESPLLDRDGQYAGQLGMITDLTERRTFENELAFQAAHDPLTGLANRLLAVDRLRLALERARPGEADVTVVVIDVDGFKVVNSSHGHQGGDQLLVEVASRLAGTVADEGSVARFGGDEFVVVADGAGLLAERLRAVLAAPFVVEGVELPITCSMGVVVGRYGDRASDLLADADLALLQAKAKGGDRTEVFSQDLRASSRERLELLLDLRRAIDRREFSLWFQPVVSLHDGSIVGAEALIRWEHPERGTLGPSEFIAVAEDSGLIDPIGQWVIEETCRHFADWQRLAPDLSMSLNISARQLTAATIQNVVGDAITDSGVDPTHLALEITEGVLMDVELSIGILSALRKTGVAISIDDFGTGYSSLSYLNRFPIDILKIDQAFVAGLPEDAYDVALVQAVMAIAEVLKFSVIAEGVETRGQADGLISLGCYKAQGYHFYRPMSAGDFEGTLLATGSS